MSLADERLNSELVKRFDCEYKIGDSYLIEIQELGVQNKKWCKAISTVLYVKSDYTVLACEKKVLMFFENDSSHSSFRVGDRYTLNTDLIPIKNKNNPGEFDSEFFYKSKGIDKIGFVAKGAFIPKGNRISLFLKWSLRSRDYLGGILVNHLSGQELALAQALILGDRSFLDPETTKDFGNSGAMHVLAVSGLHIGIILQIILFFLKLFSRFFSKGKALIIALVLIWIYTFISGSSASVLRSTFMFSVLAVSQLKGKSYNPLNSLFFTGFVLLLLNPFFLFDIGFQLSFLAMSGIFLFYRPISKWIYFRNKWIRKVWEGSAVGIAAQFVTVPLTLFYFHQFPNYFMMTNIGLMFSTGLILGLGMFVFSFYWLKYVGKMAVFLLSIVLFLTLDFVAFIDDLPGSVATGFQLHWMLVLCSFLLIICIYIFRTSGQGLKILFYCFCFTFVGYSVFQRFESMTKSEICFYNDSKTLFSVKYQDAIFCFYDREEVEVDKVKFTLNSYTKIYPGNISYLSLRSKDWKIRMKDMFVHVKRKKNGFKIFANKHRYFVKNRNSSFQTDTEVICLPWITTCLKSEINLKDGAVRFSLE